MAASNLYEGYAEGSVDEFYRTTILGGDPDSREDSWSTKYWTVSYLQLYTNGLLIEKKVRNGQDIVLGDGMCEIMGTDTANIPWYRW